MKMLKIILLGIFALIVLLFLVSFLLPQKQQVERSTDISAPAAKIYPYLANPKLFSQWSPWSKLDPSIKVQFTGPESGKDAGMSWQSDDPSVGGGSWVITHAVENESLDVSLDFGNQGGATSFFRLKPNGEKTNITWGFENDAGMNPMMRWFGLMMDKMVGSEYQKGLESLKKIVEEQ